MSNHAKRVKARNLEAEAAERRGARAMTDLQELVDVSKLRSLPRAEESVVIGYLTGGNPEHEFTASLTGLQMHDYRSSGYLVGGGLLDVLSGPRVAEGRTQLVFNWLTSELYDGSDWLLMLDDDMAFDADLLDRLMAVASYPERPIIGGLCFAGRHYGPQWPTIYEPYNLGEGVEGWGVRPVVDYPENTLVKCAATGAACLLVHRQVYVGMAAAPWNKELPHSGLPNQFPWFAEGLVAPDGAPLGEDIAFCRKAVLLGIPIHVHTGAKLGHIKRAALTEATWRGQQAEQNARLAAELGGNDLEIVRDELWVPELSQ